MKGNVFPMLEIICPAGCGRLRASRSLPHINSGGKGGSGTKGEWAELVVSQTFTRLGKIRTGSKEPACKNTIFESDFCTNFYFGFFG